MTNGKKQYLDRPGQETIIATPDCFQPSDDGVTISGMAWLQVFAACQGLMVPTGTYRATHKRCREVIREELGFCPKGKPGKPGGIKGFRAGGKDAIYEWLKVEALVHGREDLRGVVGDDDTTIWFER